MRKIYITIFIFFLTTNISLSKEFVFIFNDADFNKLYSLTVNEFKTSEAHIYKEIRGITISYPLEKIVDNNFNFPYESLKILEKIEYFLAKIKNPVIIEVHTTKIPLGITTSFKNWEISTVIANKIEAILLDNGKISQTRIKSVGYGEFLPSKNTPNNGVKNKGRVDIIILCNISGE